MLTSAGNLDSHTFEVFCSSRMTANRLFRAIN